jgi:hypothetical protein
MLVQPAAFVAGFPANVIRNSETSAAAKPALRLRFFMFAPQEFSTCQPSAGCQLRRRYLPWPGTSYNER